MTDEPVEKDEESSEAEGDKPSRSFRLRPFSRTSADWVTVGDLMRVDEGQLSVPDLLREECQQQGQPPPNDDEIAAFTASLEEVKKEASDVTATLAEQLAPKVKLAEQLGAKIVSLPPGFLESVSKAQEGWRSMASSLRRLESPQAIPMVRTTGQMTVEALASLQADLSAQEGLTNSILEKTGFQCRRCIA
ncbi:MAG TPA: hypothetical protein VME46_05660 [Acidimicrobiales bacterium]|nr:hypothetical protein [Acidimicrobiales bacterium]